MRETLSVRSGLIFDPTGTLVGFLNVKSGTSYLQTHVLPGFRVRLIGFTPSTALPDGEPGFSSGQTGTVDLVDDFGTVHVRWDNGRVLGLAPDDSYDVLDEYVIEEEGTRV